MDSYVAEFQAAGGSLVMLAKGNRSKAVKDACKAYGGFYLGSVGGPAARLAQDCIRKVEVLEYPELGMEAVWRIEVENFPGVHRDGRQGQRFLRWAGMMRTQAVIARKKPTKQSCSRWLASDKKQMPPRGWKPRKLLVVIQRSASGRRTPRNDRNR